MSQNNIINIASAFNNNYSCISAAMLSSLVQSINPQYIYNIYIIHSDITIENQIKLKSIVNKNNIKCFFIYITPWYLKQIFSNKKDFYISRHVTIETYYRIALPYILPTVDKIIYIDGDLIILNNLIDLYNTNLSNYHIAGCREKNLSNLKNLKKLTPPPKEKDFRVYKSLYDYYERHLKFSESDMKNYINAGVLIFNLKKIRENDSEQSQWGGVERKITQKNNKWNDILLNINKKFLYHDQDFLNYIFKESKLILDYKYNTPSVDVDNLTNLNDIAILHFYSTDKGKPWLSLSTRCGFIFWNNLKTTPFFFECFEKYLERKIIKTKKHKFKNFFHKAKKKIINIYDVIFKK